MSRVLGNQRLAAMAAARAEPPPAPDFEIEAPGSADEEEARTVARAVVSAPPSPPEATPRPATGPASRRPLPRSDAVAVQRALDGGSRLPQGLRARLEGFAAGDLGEVRVHRGPAASAATSRLGTRAFTVGHDVVLGPRAPEPQTPAGLALLMHEVTHTLQEPGGPGHAPRVLRREEGEEGVSDGTETAPVVDEEPDPGLNIARATRLNQVWWTQLELAGVRPLGDVTPDERPVAFANRVLRIQQASRVSHLRSLTFDRDLSTDGILGPRTLWFLWRLSGGRVPEGDRAPFVDLGVDVAALAGAGPSVRIALAIMRRPLVAARWTFSVPADEALRYYRQHYALNRNDADLLDSVLFGGPAPSDVTRDDRHELLSLLYGGQDLPGIGALVSVDRRFVHKVDSTFVVENGPRGGGRWAPYFAFRVTTPAAADDVVAALGLRVPATPRARAVRNRLGEDGPPTAALLVSIDIPEVDPAQRDAVVQQYLARQRIAREQRRAEAEEHNRMAARQRADRFIELARRRRDLRFTVDLQRLVNDFAGKTPLFFEYFLDDLRSRDPEQFTAFFDAVDGVRTFSIHAPVIRLALGTSHAGDERVRRSLGVLNSRRQGVMRSRYEAGGVRLGGAGGPLLRVGEVAGDHHGAYLRDESLDRIKPARMAQLAEVAKEKAGAIYSSILSGADTRSPSDEEVATEAFEQAAREIGLTEDDVERDVEYEESVRLTSIRQVTEDGIERSYLTWQVVERWGGSGEWTPVPDAEESGDDMAFDFRLSLYRLSQTADVVEGMAMGLLIVGTIAVAWEAGLVAVLLRAAGGAGMVLASIAISELIYVATSYWRDEPLTLRGFLFAALDGYLGALAFRVFSPLGSAISRRFVSGGTATMRRLVGTWLLSRGTVGALSGAATMPASMFARELVEVLSGDRTRFSSLGDYLTQAAYGALLGAAFEIAGSGLLSLFRGEGSNALARATDVAARIRDRHINPATWLAESAGALSRFRVWLGANLHDDLATAIARELRSRLDAVGTALGAAGRTARARWRVEVMRQMLDLAERELSRDAISGLERMLLTGQGGRALTDDAAIAIFARLRGAPERIDPFLALMKDVQTPVLDDLVARGVLGELADAPAALAMSTRLTPTGTGTLLGDAFGGSVGDLDAFALTLSGLDDGLRSHAWTALLDHRRLVVALGGRGPTITAEDVAGLGRLAAHASADEPGLAAMLAEFDPPAARRFLADASGAADRRLAELAELTGQGRDGARRYLQRQRLAQRGSTPAGPDANAPAPAQVTAPVAPVRNPTPGVREAAARAAVPDEDKIGFDIFMEQLRSGGRRPADPEAVLATRTEAQVNAIARDRRLTFEQAQREARAYARFHDDPLDPQLLHTEQVGDITLRYEGRAAGGGRPSAAEISQAQDVARATGEPVEVFGDTVMGNDYPGIDGVIGSPPRPLSLKQSNGAANVGYARVHARDALTLARGAGYSHVEVHIHMYGSTVAEIQAALRGVPANPRGTGPLFDAQDTIAKYVFHGADGSFTVEPPL